MDYVRDPDAIYAQSFAAIRAEADLAHLHPALHDAAIRMIHACGMPDLAEDIVGDPDAVESARTALAAGAPVLCDCEMVRAGIIERHLPRDNECIVTLNDPRVPDLAARLGTTRSAAAVELWRDHIAGAVVVIGNAPTALFHLLDIIAAGAPNPPPPSSPPRSASSAPPRARRASPPMRPRPSSPCAAAAAAPPLPAPPSTPSPQGPRGDGLAPHRRRR
jgi:precorrin-8X/cobalt-precorrin-8 methylmutase